MATSLHLERSSPSLMGIPAIDMADRMDVSPRRTAPRNIPAPVSIPLRSDDSSIGGASCTSSAQPSPRRQQIAPPPPMPAFVFPAQSSNSAPPAYTRPAGRRPRSVADLHDNSTFSFGGARAIEERPSRSPALPDFSFNPGATLQPASDNFLSPPHSPQSQRAVPARPSGAGHRRGGSEFVGGNLRSGDAYTLLSTSPTRSEGGLPSPSLAPVNPPRCPPNGVPPQGRRGHAHRRSAAISSHDLSDLLQPTNPPPTTRGNSAPASPAEIRPHNTFTFPEPKDDAKFSLDNMKLPLAVTDVEDDVVQPAVIPTAAPTEEPKEPLSDAKATSRVRVGFSDTLEFIPRPLSLISTDTASTIRPATGCGNTSGGHSVSGSISSVLSLNSSSPANVADRDLFSPIARSPSCATTGESRPSTAGAVLDRTQSIIADGSDGVSTRRRNSIPILSVLPTGSESTQSAAVGGTQALPSPSKTPKRWSFFSLDPFIGISSGSSSPLRPKPASPVSVEEPAVGDSVVPAVRPADQDRGFKDLTDKDAESVSKKSAKSVVRKSSSKKKKKARSWGILTRKSKPRRKSRRVPTPPPIARFTDSDDDDSQELQMPVAATIHEAIEIPPPPTVLVTPSESPTEAPNALPSWQVSPSPSFSIPDDDASFAMIDLDAALGPFNTPLPRNAEWEAAQRAGGMSKRQLHSAAGMSRFTGPGMHYSHRRAESAPEMPPFNRTGLPRFGSSAAMADVFEEDEEEEDDDASSQQPARKKHHGNEKAESVASSTSASDGTSSLLHAGDVSEKASSIDIRVTLTDGNKDITVDTAMDMSSAISEDAMSVTTISRRGSGVSGLSDDDKTQPSMGLKSEYSASSLHEDVIVEEDMFNYSFDVPDSGCDVTVESTSDSTVNAGRRKKGKDLAPVDVSPLHMPTTANLAPASPFSMSPSSSYPSPRSPMSPDTHRISTAPSSATEDNFRSLLLMGEPGPELRMSLDVPSLTSGTSTPTRDSGILFVQKAAPMEQGSQRRDYLPSREEERPASFAGAVFGQRRSSLASLHRLINSSHGERSKLSMEVPMEGNAMRRGSDSEKERHKSSRTKRISRMVQFWRTSKDEASS